MLRYTVKVDGTALADTYEITSILIHHKINTISKAEISIAENYTADFSELSAADDDALKPGSTLVVTAGYDNNAEAVLFDGIITGKTTVMNEDEPVTVTLGCKHKAVALTNRKTVMDFPGKKDSEIISALFSANGLTPTVETTAAVNEQFPKENSTDWDLVIARAEVNGFLIFLDGENVTIGKPAFDSSPVLSVSAGNDLFRFKAEANGEKQYSSVTAYSWDDASSSILSATAAEPQLNLHGSAHLADNLNELTDTYYFNTPVTQSELQTFADGRLLRTRLSATRGSFSFVGSSAVKTGSLIELKNVGKKFNGNAFVSSVTHTLSDAKWETAVQFGLDNKPISDQPNYSLSVAKSQLPLVQGLRIAKVSKLSADPGGEYRVQISSKTRTDSTERWAQLANFYATKNAGLGFLPEVGDDVVVGNIDGDPRSPVILGSLYNKTNTPPNPAQDENNYIKSITTKSLLTVSFDDEKKIIVIKTPAGNTITVSDDDKSIEVVDQTKNSIKLSTDGIVLTSKKDLKMTATGDISLAATGKLTLESKQDMTATSSMNISHKAQIGFTAKGTATAEVSATGNTTVKGGMVMIN